MILNPSVETHATGGGDLIAEAPVLVWRFPVPVRTLSSAVLGGGLGDRAWITNATVGFHYDEPDPTSHADRIAAGLGLGEAPGVGLLTAVDVRTFTTASDGGAEVLATTGLGVITWAAAPDGQFVEWRPGTVNVVAWVPETLAEPALVNLVTTIAEAKVQALLDAGIPATGTPTDAVVVCCPASEPLDGDRHRYGGPRSHWGARVARAAHAAIAAGIDRDRTRPR